MKEMTSREDHALFELVNVSYTYEAGLEKALSEVELSIAPGEWVWIVGSSRAGKSTLCGLLSGVLQSWPGSVMQGKLQYNEQDMSGFTASELAGQLGIIFQNPETSLIHEIVEDELAFGPENLCVKTSEIENRIDDALRSIDMPEARLRRTNKLSGGQMQRISIASVLTMQPHILVLDDALASLDAPAIATIMATLRDLNRKGYTIIMTAARLDYVHDTERVVILEHGRIIADGIRSELEKRDAHELIRLGCLPNSDMREMLQGRSDMENTTPILSIRDLSFAYQSDEPVLNGLNLELSTGEILAVRGANGAGKTTLGKLIAGLLSPPERAILLNGRDVTHYEQGEWARTIGYVFQNPEHMFVTDTVLEECLFGIRSRDGDDLQLGEAWLEKLGLLTYRDHHPLHLSAADKQLLSLAAVLIMQPDVLILDEPTAGLSYASTDLLMAHCADYAVQGKAVIVITHDKYTIREWTTKELVLNHI